MSTENFITASCVITGKVIYKNGQPVFTNKEGDLAAFLLSAYQHFELKYPKFYKMDNLSKLGLLASEVLLKPGFDNSAYTPEEIGVVLANSSSSLDTDVRYFETVSDIASPALFVYTLPNIMIGEICIRNGFKGENAFFVFKRFDGSFMHDYVSNLLDTNILAACICGWVELMDDRYHAVLYLVEKSGDTNNGIRFTNENITNIYAIENG